MCIYIYIEVLVYWMSPKAKGWQMKLLRFSTCCGICGSLSGGILNYFESSIAKMILREFYKFLFLLMTTSLGIIPNLGLIWLKKDSGCCILGIIKTKLAGPLLILLAQP